MTDKYFDFKGLTVEKIKQYVDEIQKDVKNTLDGVVAVKGQKTFANTIQPQINSYTFNMLKTNSFQYASNFYPDKKVRDAGSDASTVISKFSIEQSQRKDVYFTVKEYYDKYYNNEKDILTSEERRCVEHMMRDFRREGLHIEDNKELKEIKKRLSELKIKFSKNVNEENTTFEFTKKELDGMPESWFKNKKPVKDDVYKFTLKYPDVLPGLRYINNPELRRKLHFAFNNRCAKENTPLFEEAVKLRYRMAKILGYSDFADYATEVKVIKTGKNAVDFEDNLNKLFTPVYEKDMKQLTQFAKEYKPNQLGKDELDMWDMSYYMRAFKEKECSIDLEEVKKYFPLDVVRNGMFKIYQNLLGLNFEEITTDNKWHESVQLFKVTDKESSELMGYFYLDMFPREGKYGHAAVFQFMYGCDMKMINNKDERLPNICAMACNFPKDSCIGFNDVVTFFHEFGHVMHTVCGKTQLAEFNGFNVEWDFVEAPSQQLENYCYCDEPMKLMSKHQDNGESLPLETINKLKKLKKSLAGYSNKRQLLFGIYDLRCHTLKFDNDEKFDSRTMWEAVQKDVLGFGSKEEYNRAASFGHLMGGYEAGYYGYLRSLTYATNMFYVKFKDGHVLDPKVGMRYRKKLLEPGATKDSLDLLKDFLGEEPNDKYFLIDNGLETKK